MDHPTLIAQSNFLRLMVGQGKLEQADDYSVELIKKMSRYIGPTHKNTKIIKCIRTFLLEDLGRLADTEQLYIGLIKGYENLEDEKYLDYSNALNNYAMLQRKQQKTQQSKQTFEKLLVIIEQHISKKKLLLCFVHRKFWVVIG